MSKGIPFIAAFLVLIAPAIRSQARLKLVDQVDVALISSWLPIQVGDRWIYAVESRSGDRKQPAIQNWTIEEVVSKVVKVPEGLVVVKAVRDLTPRGQSAGADVAASAGSSFLVHDNCAYFLVGRDDWDDAHRQIGARFKKDLNKGDAEPDLCFPMQKGSHWGEFESAWHVVGVGPSDLAGPKYPESFHITGRLGNGDATDVWFAKGVGMVAMRYRHQGTYTKTLRSFRAYRFGKS